MYRAQENTSIKKYSKVVHSSVGLSSLFYIAVALAGYITFTDMSQGMLGRQLFSVYASPEYIMPTNWNSFRTTVQML